MKKNATILSLFTYFVTSLSGAINVNVTSNITNIPVSGTEVFNVTQNEFEDLNTYFDTNGSSGSLLYNLELSGSSLNIFTVRIGDDLYSYHIAGLPNDGLSSSINFDFKTQLPNVGFGFFSNIPDTIWGTGSNVSEVSGSDAEKNYEVTLAWNSSGFGGFRTNVFPYSGVGNLGEFSMIESRFEIGDYSFNNIVSPVDISNVTISNVNGTNYQSSIPNNFQYSIAIVPEPKHFTVLLALISYFIVFLKRPNSGFN